MLLVDIRDLGAGPVETTAQLESVDPVLEGLDLEFEGPVQVRGQLQATGTDEFLWRGQLSGRLRTTCRRCLTDLTLPLQTEVGVLFSTDPDAADDPSVYLVPEPVTHVDVGPAVREEIALAAPRYALCREDCRGLCQRCGADLNAGPCRCTAPAEPV
jgi:uncharacterized protein